MASEVGNGQVSIFPVFRGFRSKVNNEVATSGREAGRSFEKAFGSSTRDLGSEPLKKLQAQVASSSKALSRARLTEQDAAGKVRTAEVALTEARKKGGAQSARAVAAEERLASAQRRLATAQDTTRSASKKLQESQKQLKSATDGAANSSETGARKYARGWTGLKQRLGSTLSGAVRDASKQAEQEAQSGGDGAAKAFGGRLKTGLGRVVKIAGGTAGLIAGVFSGIGIKGGVERVLNIQDAKASLDGLGHSAQSIEKIMGNANTAVKGTAFGLADAAGAAGTFAAAGIKPGKEMERVLGLVGDSATIAKVEYGEMSSIFGKAAAKGKLDGEILAQLLDKQIGILPGLAKMYGVTEEEASKMVSKGKVSFEDFAKVMETTVGGAAQKSGDTFRGAWANTRAAMSRIGATIMTPLLDSMQQGMAWLTPLLDKMNTALGPVMTSFGEWLSEVSPAVLGEITGGFTAMFAAFKDGGSDVTSSGFAGVLERIGLIARFVSDEVIGSVRAMFAAFQDGGTDVTSSGLAGFFERIGLLARELWDALGPLVMDLAAAFAPLIAQVFDLWMTFSPLTLLFQVIQPMLPLIAGMLSQLGTAIGGLVAIVIPLVTQIAGALLPLFMQLASAVLPLVVEAVGFLVNILQPLINLLGPILTGIINALLPVVVTIFGFIVTTIQNVVNVIRGIIMVFSGLFIGDWQMMWDGLVMILGAAKDQLLNVLNTIPQLIMDVFSGIGTWLLDSGKALVQGLIDGILSMGNVVGDAVGGFIQGVRDFFPFSPAKKGPFSGTGYTTYSGKALASDFASSIESETGTVKTAATKITNAAALAGSVDVATNANSSAATVTGTANGQPVEIHVHPSEGMDEEAFAQKVKRIIEEIFGRG